MSIEVAIKQIIECKAFKQCDTEKDSEAFEVAIDTMRKYQMFQIDYEARLKADLVAMLTEIQLEIEESENCGKAFHLGLQMASNIIQQKINGLKGENEG